MATGFLTFIAPEPYFDIGDTSPEAEALPVCHLPLGWMFHVVHLPWCSQVGAFLSLQYHSSLFLPELKRFPRDRL
jgi:hypothetical protein